MAIKYSTGLSNAMLASSSLKAAIEGASGFYVLFFSGSVPASPDDALDMASDHTQLLKLTVSGDGSTGLTLAASASNRTIAKNAAETWSGTIDFSGTVANGTAGSPQTATCTFFRIVESTDSGQDAGTSTDVRIQGTCGEPGSGADLIMTDTDMTDNESNTKGLTVFELRLPSP